MSETGAENELGGALRVQLKAQFSLLDNERLALELLQHYDQFIETEDFNWVDLMVWRLRHERFDLPTAVQILAARIAHQRLLGSGARNKQSIVIKKYSKDLAMHTMAGNIGLNKGRGVKSPIKAAAREAANAVHAICGYAPHASSLAKRYSAYWKGNPTAKYLEEGLENEVAKLRAEADFVAKQFRNLPHRAEGTRR